MANVDMNSRFLSRIIICMLSVFLHEAANGQTGKPFIRVARIVVDSTDLGKYNAALKEGVETAVRVEPGVLALYAVADKDRPTHITVFEIYASEEAYKSHLQTPHFKKYKAATMDMVKSLELMDTSPIALAAKQH
jgi:quinol monooxygenase YgiN